MKVYLAEEVRESISLRMPPLKGIEKDFDFVVDMMLHGANAFEIVQCKDCRHKVTTTDGEYNPEDIVCDYWATDGLEETDFCSYGERKGGDDE